MGEWDGLRVYTIGHSTRSLEEFLALLRGFDVRVLADIRTVPRSRHNPQFNKDSLPRALASQGIRYAHLARLGGLRHARKDSPNAAWRNASFRGYADHMQTADFEAGLRELRALSSDGAVALMCAEAVPFRCHRSLVADALTARGAQVADIQRPGRAAPHRMTPFAHVNGAQVTYPADAAPEDAPLADKAHGEGPRTSAREGALATQGPFHLEATVRVLARSPNNAVERWCDDRYLRLYRVAGGLTLVEVRNHGSIDAPDVRYVVRRGRATRSLEPTLRRVLGLDVAPAPLTQRMRKEPSLRPLARAVRGMRPPRFSELFETFANVVPFQQVSLSAGVAVVGRLVERFGRELVYEGQTFHAFPRAEDVADARLDALRRCGLSASKAESLRALARLVASGELTEATLARMDTREALERLVALSGIGPWSANLVLLRGLGRLDAFPPGDVGARRGLRDLLGLGAQAPLDRVLERFGDRRGYLYFCALANRLLAEELIHPAP